MRQWIGYFVIAACGVAHSQTDDDSSQQIGRALRNFNKAQVFYQGRQRMVGSLLLRQQG